MIAKKCKGMSRHQLKEYSRPYMVVETFVPNEYVAGCVQSATVISGQMCFDQDHDLEFDWQPDERDYLSNPLGIYAESFYAGNFVVKGRGRYIYNGGETYLYIGPGGKIDDPGLTVPEYFYSDKNLFAPIYYARLLIYRSTEPEGHEYYFYYTDKDTFGGVTNAS